MQEITWQIWLRRSVPTGQWDGLKSVTTHDIVQRIATLLTGPGGTIRPFFQDRVRILTGPQWQGSRRWKGGKLRALFDITDGPDGNKQLWIHDIFVKDISDPYSKRLHLSQKWKHAHSQGEVARWTATPPLTGRYTIFQPHLKRAAGDDLHAQRVETWELDDEQFQIMQGIYPLRETSETSQSWVQLVSGPPGSGKTVVAQNAVRQAIDANDTATDILVLVPTKKLQRVYRRDITSEAKEHGLFEDFLHLCDTTFRASCTASINTDGPDTDEKTHVWVDTYEEAFDSSLPALRHWWPTIQTMLQRNVRTKKHLRAIEKAGLTRFLRLFDATFLDGIVVPDSGKDALLKQDADLLDAIRFMESGGNPRKWPLTQIGKNRPELRWERARAFGELLKTHRRGRNLLILVDEAQDLAPSEWQALIQAVQHRREDAQHGLAGIALLGDENQRIVPTSFAWKWVKDWCHTTPSLPSGSSLPIQEMRGSYRTPRSVARLAAAIMQDASFRLPNEKPRSAPAVDWKRLDASHLGRIHVYQCPPNTTSSAQLQKAVASLPENISGELVVLSEDSDQYPRLDDEDAPKPRVVIDPIDIVQAKGSEWEHIVLQGIFPKKARDFDERCRTYTRLTRARRDVIILADPHTHDRAAIEHWKQLLNNDTSSDAQAIQANIHFIDDFTTLTEVISEMMGSATEQTIDQLIDRLQEVLQQAMDDQHDQCPESAWALIERITDRGGAPQLLAIIEPYFQARPDWLAATPRSPKRHTLQLLAAGDIIQAWLQARAQPYTALDDAMAIAAESSPLSMTIATIVEQKLAPDLGRAVECAARRQIDLDSIHHPPTPHPLHLEGGMITPGLAKSISRHSNRIASAIAQSLDEQMNRIRQNTQQQLQTLHCGRLEQLLRDIETELEKYSPHRSDP